MGIRKLLSEHKVYVLWVLLAAMLLLSFSPRNVMAASAKKITMMRGDTKQLRKKNVVWVSKNPAVASVSQNGLVTAQGRGKTTVIARRGKKKYRFKITVEAPVFNQASIKVPLDQTATVKIVGTSKKFAVQSSDSSVVRVKKTKKNTFKITALKDGAVTLTGIWKNSRVYCSVTAGKGKQTPKKTESPAQPDGPVTLSHNGIVLLTISRNKSSIAKQVSAVSSYGQSAPLYTSIDGGDGLECIFAETNNGNVNIVNIF